MKHIILIGFKHTGKSVVGRVLANQLGKNFIDLDEVVEELNAKENDDKLTRRQIVEIQGLEKFRELEGAGLKKVMAEAKEPCVLSVGGGTPLAEENRKLIRGHDVVLITAPRGIVFERIMVNGKPAFFSDNEEPTVCFKRIWEEREPIYRELAQCTIENHGAVEEAVAEIRGKLNL